MILNTGQRTDIPAFFGTWFFNRIKAGFVLVRNPYNPAQITRYRLDPALIDLLCFCSKNPAPMLPRLGELSDYRQLWHLTITPYGTDIEPAVPHWKTVADSLIALSEQLGSDAVFWRYDPIFFTETYDLGFHTAMFEEMCAYLETHVQNCVISFIDLYEKTRRNFPGIRAVTGEEQMSIARAFSGIAAKHRIRLIGCCETPALGTFGIDTSGCMTQAKVETLLGESLEIPSSEGKARPACACLIGHDIGAYNTCSHGCLYCYANHDAAAVRRNRARHDPDSALLIGHPTPDEHIRDAKQIRYGHGQLQFTFS